MPDTRNKNIFYVGLLSFFGGISQDIFSPILPIYLTSVLGFDKTFVGIAEGLVTASVNVFKVVAGFLSDKFKKQKPLIFAGYFLSMISRPLLAMVSSAVPVFGLRFLDGAGKGLKDPPKDVLIAGSATHQTRGRSFGIARMLDTLGSVAGPLLLALLLYLLKNSASLFHRILFFSALPLVITLILVIVKVKEVPKAENRESSDTREPLPTAFFVFLSIVFLFTLGNSSDAFLVLRAKTLGATLIQIPLILAIFNLVYGLAAVPFGSLSDKIGRVPTLLIGWLVYAGVYLGFAFAQSAVWAWFLYGAYGIYYASNEGVAKAFLSDIVGTSHRGRAFGIYGTVVGLGTLPASFLAGYLWDRFGPSVPFYFGASIAFMAAVLLLIFSSFIKTRRAQ
jgi:MFS family permease